MKRKIRFHYIKVQALSCPSAISLTKPDKNSILFLFELLKSEIKQISN